jgi:hypothetical protein
MSWRANFRSWAEEAGVELEAFKGYTLYQFRMYCVEREELGLATLGNPKPKRVSTAQTPAEKQKAAPIVITNDCKWKEQLGIEPKAGGKNAV